MRYAHKLPKSKFVNSRDKYLLQLCSNKRVLHLGFVDTGLLNERLERGEWFHQKLCDVASDVVGIDISAEGVNIAKSKGFDQVFIGDVEKLSHINFPQKKYDVILVADIIEHLTNFGDFLSELNKIVSNDTIIIISTPNALNLRSIIYPIARIEKVHPGHNVIFSPTTLSNLLKRYSFVVMEISLYGKIRMPFRHSKAGLLDLISKTFIFLFDCFINILFVRIFPYFAEGMIISAKKNE